MEHTFVCPIWTQGCPCFIYFVSNTMSPLLASSNPLCLVSSFQNGQFKDWTCWCLNNITDFKWNCLFKSLDVTKLGSLKLGREYIKWTITYVCINSHYINEAPSIQVIYKYREGPRRPPHVLGCGLTGVCGEVGEKTAHEMVAFL